MKRIRLTPKELKSQATEMTSLMGEYESLFGSVINILNNTNNHWSANLSHNFAGKITSAQKGFSTVIDMLQYGATAANSSAESFEGIDVSLSKNIALRDNLHNFQVMSMNNRVIVEENYDMVQETMGDIKEEYEDIPKWIRELGKELANKEVGEGVIDAYELVVNIFSEEKENWSKMNVNPEIVEGFGTLFGIESAKAKALGIIYDMVINKKDTFGELMVASEHFNNDATKKFLEGDISTGIKYAASGVGIGLFNVILYGPFEALTELGAASIKDFEELKYSLWDSISSIVPGPDGVIIKSKMDFEKKMVDSACEFISGLL